MVLLDAPLMFRRKPKVVLEPELLLVGLGNPGPEYRGTRHNVGFEVLEQLASAHKIQMKTFRHRSVYGVGEVEARPVALAKPLTYMNLSGGAVVALMRQFGLKPSQILVVSDDMDLELGRIRLKPKGSSGGHNGHRSIIESLRTEEYARLKVGIGKQGQAIEHVLSRFSPNEREKLELATSRAVRACEVFVSEGLERAMNVANSS